MTKLVDLVFEEQPRFRLHPWDTAETPFLSGALNAGWTTVDDPPVFASGAYSLGGAWTVVGIVTELTVSDGETIGDSSLGSVAMQVVASLGAMNQLVSPTDLAIPLLPLAIYREI